MLTELQTFEEQKDYKTFPIKVYDGRGREYFATFTYHCFICNSKTTHKQTGHSHHQCTICGINYAYGIRIQPT